MCERALASFIGKVDAVSLSTSCNAYICSSNLTSRHHCIPVAPIFDRVYRSHPVKGQYSGLEAGLMIVT